MVLIALAIWLIARNNDDSTPDVTIPTSVLAPASSVTDLTAVPTVTGPGGVATGPPASIGSAAGTPIITGAGAGAVASTTSSGAATSASTTSAAATGATTSTAAATAAPTTVASNGAAPAGGAAPALLGNGQDLVAVSSTPGTLAGLSGAQVTGRATVQSVVSDEGFWVGSSVDNRVFVLLSAQARGTTGESPFQVQAGQVVEITGTLTPAGSKIPADVDQADGLQQLRDQGVFVEAATLALVS